MSTSDMTYVANMTLRGGIFALMMVLPFISTGYSAVGTDAANATSQSWYNSPGVPLPLINIALPYSQSSFAFFVVAFGLNLSAWWSGAWKGSQKGFDKDWEGMATCGALFFFWLATWLAEFSTVPASTTNTVETVNYGLNPNARREGVNVHTPFTFWNVQSVATYGAYATMAGGITILAWIFVIWLLQAYKTVNDVAFMVFMVSFDVGELCDFKGLFITTVNLTLAYLTIGYDSFNMAPNAATDSPAKNMSSVGLMFFVVAALANFAAGTMAWTEG